MLYPTADLARPHSLKDCTEKWVSEVIVGVRLFSKLFVLKSTNIYVILTT